MRVIFARCSVTYSGRVDAELELSDVLLIRKDDGAVIIHATAGLKEKNWMPSGSSWEESPGLIVSEFPKRGERLEIYLDTVYSDTEHQGELSGKLIRIGGEREMADILSMKLHLIAPGLSLVAREARTPVGPIDILCVDKKGNPVAVELKRGASGVGPEVAYQLLRYIHALEVMPEWQGKTPRGILVAPSLRRGMKELLDERGLSFVRLTYQDVVDA